MYSTILLSAMAMGGLFGRSSCENGNCDVQANDSVEMTQVAMRGRGLRGRRQMNREPQRDPSFVAPTPEPVMEPLSEDVEVRREASIRRLLGEYAAEAVIRTPEYAAPVPSQATPVLTREDIREIARDAVEEILAVHLPAPTFDEDMTGVGLFDGPVPTIGLMKAKPPDDWIFPGVLGGVAFSALGLARRYLA